MDYILTPVWENKKEDDYRLNAFNLSAVLPDILYAEKKVLVADETNRKQLILKAHSAFKMFIDNEPKVFRVKEDLTIDVGYCILDETEHTIDSDTGYATLINGTDYAVYIVYDNDTAKIAVSTNQTTPKGYTESNSRKIGGFHTLCMNVTLNKITYVSGDIIPNSVYDDINKPTLCSPLGMVYNKNINLWVDIYAPSSYADGGLIIDANPVVNYKTKYKNTVLTGITPYDALLGTNSVNKRLLSQNEYVNCALLNNKRYEATPFNTKTTGGNYAPTFPRLRLCSDIFCEDIFGAYGSIINSFYSNSEEEEVSKCTIISSTITEKTYKIDCNVSVDDSTSFRGCCNGFIL